MPNHVTNILKITGDEELVKRIRDEISDVDEDGHTCFIDFNKIIPMPDELRIESSTLVDNGIAIIEYRKGNRSAILDMLTWHWVREEGITDPDVLVERLIEKGSANLELGQRALDNIEKYGHKDWYSWAIDAWDTKWNAYSQEDLGEDGISFQTAWSNPLVVMAALSLKYPDAEFNVRYADEDLGQNVGEYTLRGGNIVYEDFPEAGSEEALLMAIDITGYEDIISDQCFDIDPDYSVDDLEDYDKKWIRIAYSKGVLDNYPKCVLDYLIELALEDENYEFAQKVKETTSWYEIE